jgi:L-lactate dehydrogenase complex protein LldG
MKESTAKEKMLKRIREALIEPSPYVIPDVDFESPIYVQSDEPLEIQFAQEFQHIDGKFVFCETKEEVVENFTALAKQFGWKDIYCYNDDITQWFEGTEVKIKDKIWDVLEAKVAITKCESLIARLGAVLMSSKLSGRVPWRKSTIGSILAEATNQKIAGLGSNYGEFLLQVSKKEPHLGEVLEY